MELRLNKYLALAGVSSRRGADRLIEEGRIKVNGEPVRQLGVRVETGRDLVEVDDRPVALEAPTFWGALHKPPGYLTTWRDPFGRSDLGSLLESVPTRVYPVGRLDQDSEGLLIITNDGELAYRLSHPRYEVEKEYEVQVEGEVEPGLLDHLRRGVVLSDGPARVRRVSIVRSRAGGGVFLLTLTEGRKREVRRMMESVGLSVKRLVRVRVGGVRLGDLPSGDWRLLSSGEVLELRRLVGLPAPRAEGELEAGEGGAEARRPPRGAPGRRREGSWEEY